MFISDRSKKPRADCSKVRGYGHNGACSVPLAQHGTKSGSLCGLQPTLARHRMLLRALRSTPKSLLLGPERPIFVRVLRSLKRVRSAIRLQRPTQVVFDFGVCRRVLLGKLHANTRLSITL